MRRRALIIVYLTVFIDLLGLGILLPVLPFYAQSFDASGLAVGGTLAIYSFMQLFSSPILGGLSDRYGRRPVMLISLLGSAISLTVTGFAGSLLILLVGRALSGIFGGAIAAAQAYVADVTEPEERSKYIGYIGAMTGLGFVFGPALGATLAPFGLGTAALFAAGLAAVNFVMGIFFLPETRVVGKDMSDRTVRTFSISRITGALKHPTVGRLLLAGFLGGFAFAGVQATFALLGERNFGLNSSLLGIMFTSVGLLSVLMQTVVIGRLTTRFGERATLVAGLLFMAMSQVALPLAGRFLAALAALGAQSVGNSLTNPTLASLITQTASPDEKGSLLGVNQSLGALARGVGPIVSGLLFDQSMALPYLVGGAMVIIGAWQASRLTIGERRPAKGG